MRLTVLGSGSRGNALLVESGETRLLIDAGFSARDLERRLGAVEVDPRSVTALLITHDHSDHTRGMGVFARRWGVPLFISDATRAACSRLLDGSEQVHSYGASESVQIGPLRIDPFLTVHDAVEPIAVMVTESDSAEKLGIATDLGCATATVRHALAGCDVLVLESNHDEILLRDGPYPWAVKARIGSRHGHLSNRAAAELARELHHSALNAVVLAHLSESSNDVALAHDTVGAALERVRFRGTLCVADQGKPTEPICLTSLRRSRLPPQLSLL